jgi:hypothetical protein
MNNFVLLLLTMRYTNIHEAWEQEEKEEEEEDLN